MDDLIPCRTCRFCTFRRVGNKIECRHPTATKLTPNFFAGIIEKNYLLVDDARADIGPCTPAAIYWEEIP
jgi:hypothetical protein